jgi:TetR/AcrR family transcriptional repressor of nem operon
MPILPPEVAAEVQAYFRMLSACLARVLERGAKQGTLKLSGSAKSEAEVFMAAVHGAMISARAYNDPKAFKSIIKPVLNRLKAN